MAWTKRMTNSCRYSSFSNLQVSYWINFVNLNKNLFYFLISNTVLTLDIPNKIKKHIIVAYDYSVFNKKTLILK